MDYSHSLGIVANVAEILAGLAIVFSVIKVWPAFSNLNRISRKSNDWSKELKSIRDSLAPYGWEDSVNNLEEALDGILTATLLSQASDLHIDVKELNDKLSGVLRIRRYGLMEELCRYEPSMHGDLIAVIKERAGIEPGELSQSGRISYHLKQLERPIDFRVRILPAVMGESVTLRVLDRTAASLPFDVLGIQEDDLANLNDALHAESGLLVFCGPTGSGKTVSLYTSLNNLDHQRQKIVTIEDPVEIDLPTLTQFSVVDETGRRFSDVLRGVLDSGPDVLMIGEIRNQETAEACIRAAGTGHLVLTSMHTKSAVMALEALKRYGDDLNNVDNIFLMNQRLARVLCRSCSEPRQLSEEDEAYITEICDANRGDTGELRRKYRRKVGCNDCQDGYRGRLGVYETLRVTPQLLKLNDREGVFEAAITQGMTSVPFRLLSRAARGHTSLEEVRRVAEDYLV